MTIRLKDIKSPMMEVELADGEIRTYDPFVIIRSISPYIEEGESSYPRLQAAAREAFALPDSVTDYQVLFLIRELVKFVEESGAVKGLMPVPQT